MRDTRHTCRILAVKPLGTTFMEDRKRYGETTIRTGFLEVCCEDETWGIVLIAVVSYLQHSNLRFYRQSAAACHGEDPNTVHRFRINTPCSVSCRKFLLFHLFINL
jgi:hypothetical protein